MIDSLILSLRHMNVYVVRCKTKQRRREIFGSDGIETEKRKIKWREKKTQFQSIFDYPHSASTQHSFDKLILETAHTHTFPQRIRIDGAKWKRNQYKLIIVFLGSRVEKIHESLLEMVTRAILTESEIGIVLNYARSSINSVMSYFNSCVYQWPIA